MKHLEKCCQNSISNMLNHDEQEKVFDQIRLNHERLRHDYLQSKEDYNVLKRSTPNLADINLESIV
jgi:hypothetical protein